MVPVLSIEREAEHAGAECSAAPRRRVCLPCRATATLNLAPSLAACPRRTATRPRPRPRTAPPAIARRSARLVPCRVFVSAGAKHEALSAEAGRVAVADPSLQPLPAAYSGGSPGAVHHTPFFSTTTRMSSFSQKKLCTRRIKPHKQTLYARRAALPRSQRPLLKTTAVCETTAAVRRQWRWPSFGFYERVQASALRLQSRPPRRVQHVSAEHGTRTHSTHVRVHTQGGVEHNRTGD